MFPIRKILFISLLIGLLFLQPICLASSYSINVGNIPISLGESKQSVITKLWNYYDLVPDKTDEGTYQLVAKKGQVLSAPTSITFKNGEVFSITKTSGVYSEANFAKKLLEIMESHLKDNNSSANIEIVRDTKLHSPTDSLIFIFPGKKVTVNIAKNTNKVTVIETLTQNVAAKE